MLVLRLQRCPCSPARRLASIRLYASQSAIPELPPPKQWQTKFPINNTLRRERAVLKDPDTARSVARSFLSQAKSDNGGKIVIEAFPGEPTRPGALSRAMLELPSSDLRKLIILEEDEQYLAALKPLEEADPRVRVIPVSGHNWDSYNHIQELGLLEGVQSQPWDGPRTSCSLHENPLYKHAGTNGSLLPLAPNLHFVAHLPINVKGEQLVAQLFRCIPERSWLFQYGRVPMSLILTEYLWSRLNAQPRSLRRSKLAVIGEATADFQETTDSTELAPYADRFHPIPPASAASRAVSKKVGQPMHAITAIPYADQVIQRGDIDKWDYCLRRLFVLKTIPLKTALNSLAPGASTLVKTLTSTSLPLDQRVKLTKCARDMTIVDWTLLVRAFNNWPFRPENLMITDAFKEDID
ncbi:S-adenosyl-L-methionine-dependent methyltransferase [Lenzites betulinus]|nr:S-adenosyl-L-methionine-dependent methyltransferase [Lenzites betulinus]